MINHSIMLKGKEELSKLWKNTMYTSQPFDGLTHDDCICLLFQDSNNYLSPESFAAECASGIPFVDPEDENESINPDAYQQLYIFWRVLHAPANEFFSMLGLSLEACSVRFCFPLQVIQTWASGACPLHPAIRLMMAEAVGILDIRSRQSAD